MTQAIQLGEPSLKIYSSICGALIKVFREDVGCHNTHGIKRHAETLSSCMTLSSPVSDDFFFVHLFSLCRDTVNV